MAQDQGIDIRRKERYTLLMRLEEIQEAICQLSPTELAEFAAWFEEFQAELWDTQIEQDALAGRLDALATQAHHEFGAGHCRSL